jgi:beta-lactamase regulating signal transducer with metallopeptidase domain
MGGEPAWLSTTDGARVEPALAGAPPSDAIVEAEAEHEPMLATATVGERSVPPSTSSAAVTTEPSRWTAVVPWVLVVLGLGAWLGVASVAVAFAALRRQLRGRRALADGTLLTLLEGLRRRAGVGRPVRLAVAPRVQVPMAVGVLRPEIIVPPKAVQGLPPAHQESLLAHELAHVLRHDPAWRLVALLVERVFFFQPLNRLASRRVAQSAEYLCDDWAARHTRQPLALASCLTEIATWVARTGPVAATMAGPRSILGRRVQRLLQPGRAGARPWWLGAALGLPLLGVVALAPGVGAHAHAKGDRRVAERIVVIDEDGHRHELRPEHGSAIVVHERDGELVVRSLEGAAAEPMIAGDGRSRRDARKLAREQERARDEARRAARKELRRAFRAAKARGEAAPSRAEVDAILRRAHGVELERAPHRSHPEHVELHVRVPGELELHGRVPLDLEALEDGIEDGLEGLRMLEGLEELEDLGPMLEAIEEALEDEGLDVVIRRRPGVDDPELRIVLSPEQARREAERERAELRRSRDAHVDAARRDAQREAARMEREAEALRRRIERAHRERLRQEAPEPPTVWVMPAPPVPAPLPPPARPPSAMHEAPPAPPAPPARGLRRRMPAPAAPHAPLPPVAPSTRSAPLPPQPDAGPVVWVSWPPPTSSAAVARG